MSIHFTKMQALGNDFVIIDTITQTVNLTPALIKKIADRHYGVGCDQVLIIGASTHAQADFDYTIYNADGSRAKQCGNGARCVALFVKQQHLTSKDRITFATFDHLTTVVIQDASHISAHLGVPDFNPARLPLLLAPAISYTLMHEGTPITFGALSIGNPHAIIMVDSIASAPVQTIGIVLNQHPAFPEGVNVSFCQIMTRTQVKLRVFERGVGETLACGSAAGASMAYLRHLNKVDNTVRLSLPGGDLDVTWSGNDNAVVLTGDAQCVFTGIYNSD